MPSSVAQPTFKALEQLAKAATDEVRADAERAGTLLPAWRNGEVVFVDPVTGALTAAQVAGQ